MSSLKVFGTANLDGGCTMLLPPFWTTFTMPMNHPEASHRTHGLRCGQGEGGPVADHSHRTNRL